MTIEGLFALAWRNVIRSAIPMVTAMSCSTALSAGDSTSTQDQATFVAKALHNLSTIDSMSAEYTISHSSAPQMVLRYRYMRSDNGTYLEDRTESVDTPQMESIDSDFKYHWRKIDGLIHASVKEQAVGRSEFHLKHTPENALGTRIFDALGMGLADVLSNPEIVVDAGTHTITLSNFAPQRAGGALTVKAQFDPDHDFLPNVIETTLTDPENGSGYLQRWEVPEYFRVKDGDDGETRWFPRKATLTQDIPNSVTMEIQDAAVNIEIPAETFTPDFPAGTQVYDATKEGGGGSYVVGVNGPELDTRADALAQGTAVRASSSMLIFVNVALILVIAGFIAWKRFISPKRSIS